MSDYKFWQHKSTGNIAMALTCPSDRYFHVPTHVYVESLQEQIAAPTEANDLLDRSLAHSEVERHELNKKLGTAIEAHQAALDEIRRMGADCKVMAESVLNCHNSFDRCVPPTRYDEYTCDACTVARRYCEQHV